MPASVAFSDLGGETLDLVLAVILLELLERIESIPAHMAHRDTRRLGIFMRELDQFLAAVLVEFGNAQANGLAFGRGRQAEIGIDDALLDRLDQRLVPDAHRDQARLRHGDAGALVERHLRAIGIDHHRIEQMRRGAPRAQTGQFCLERGGSSRHAPLDFVHVMSGIGHDASPASWTAAG